MTKKIKVLSCIVFSLFFAFLMIGYAAVADTLVINGSVSIPAPPNEVIITKVEVVDSATTGTAKSESIILPTTIDSSIKASSGQTVTYKITVQNYSSYRYSYIGIIYDAGTENNSVYGNGLTVTVKNAVTDTANTFGEGTTIEAKGSVDASGKPLDTLTFYATYSIGNGTPAEIRTLLNYKFGIHAGDEGKAAVDGALAQFKKILNTESSYNRLIKRYNSNVNSWLRADHIGNVATSLIAGIFTDDDELIIDLFEGALMLGDTEVKTLIKRINVDGKTGNEMVIYLTPTNIMGMKIDNSRTYIPDVYCAAFTNSNYDSSGNPTGEWFQIGDLYNGKAQGLRYTTGTGPNSVSNADCIKYNTWISTGQTIEVNDDYSYSVAADKDISSIIQAKNGAVSSIGSGNPSTVLQNLLNDAAKVKVGNFTGTGWNQFNEIMTELNNVYHAYNDTGSGNLTVANNLTHAQTVSSIRLIEEALIPFRDWLDSNP